MKKDPSIITLLTYNILGGVNAEMIIGGLATANEKPDIICFQEFPKGEKAKEFIKYFGEDYDREHSLSLKLLHRTLGLTTFYNKKRLKLKRSHIIHLPQKKLSRPESIVANMICSFTGVFDRTALITTFEVDQKELTVVNVHLSLEGGKNHKLVQFMEATRRLEALGITKNIIICGDFNLNSRSRTFKKLKKTALAKEFEELSKNIRYTHNITSPYMFPEDKTFLIRKILKLGNLFGLKTRRKIDHAFGKGLLAFSSKTINIKGSDHNPIITKFKID